MDRRIFRPPSQYPEGSWVLMPEQPKVPRMSMRRLPKSPPGLGSDSSTSTSPVTVVETTTPTKPIDKAHDEIDQAAVHRKADLGPPPGFHQLQYRVDDLWWRDIPEKSVETFPEGIFGGPYSHESTSRLGSTVTKSELSEKDLLSNRLKDKIVVVNLESTRQAQSDVAEEPPAANPDEAATPTERPALRDPDQKPHIED